VKRRDFVHNTGWTVAALAVPSFALEPSWWRSPGQADLLLRGATVYDGTGAPPVQADVAVTGDRISGLGPSLSPGGATVVDVSGLALAPGFIDTHSHSERALVVDPRAESKIRQGVTCEILGQDGGSVGPWRGGEDSEDERVRDVEGLFAQYQKQGIAVNVASMIGAGTLRRVVMGNDDRPPTAEELERMVVLVEEARDGGACGVSSGLEYVPGGFAELSELVALARPFRGTGLPYASHMRNEDDRLLGAIEEALMIGRVAEVPVHVSHLKAQESRNWWKAQPALDLLDAGGASGMDVTFDRYPYVAYSTGLSNLFPLWSRDGGTEAFLGRLRDPEDAGRIEAAVRDKVAKLGSWDAVQVTSTRADSLAWARGKRLGRLAEARGVEPYRLLLTLIEGDGGGGGMVGFGMSEENTERMLAHPRGTICSDGSALSVEGELARGTPHPRSFGTFPRVLGHYVRERKIMSLETAVHKMTGMAARRMRLEGRGRIAPGAFADLVAFDPNTVADRATFENPHQYPVGIPHVMVNGRWAVRDGGHTGELAGVVVRVGGKGR